MLEKKESQKNIKVGILMPQSTEYPKARINFVNGIKLYFTLFENRFQRGKVELIIEDVGFGSTSIVNEKAHKLLIQDQVDFIVGHLSSSTALELAEMLSQVDMPVLISNLGEVAVKSGSVPHNLYFNTFQFWQSYYHLGQFLSEKAKNDWLLISSLYDTGYDPLRAFRAGLLSNNANITNEIYLNSHDRKELIIEFDKHMKNIEGVTPALFLPPLLLNQFVDDLTDRFEEMVITPFYSNKNPVKKHWAFAAESLKPSEPNFVEGVGEYLDTSPDLFHVLGFRSGAMIYEAAKSLDDPQNDKANILKAWKDFSFQFGEEALAVDHITHELTSDVKIFKGKSCMTDFDVCDTRIANDIPENLLNEMTMKKTVFTNPYMFY